MLILIYAKDVVKKLMFLYPLSESCVQYTLRLYFLVSWFSLVLCLVHDCLTLIMYKICIILTCHMLSSVMDYAHTLGVSLFHFIMT